MVPLLVDSLGQCIILTHECLETPFPTLFAEKIVMSLEVIRGHAHKESIKAIIWVKSLTPTQCWKAPKISSGRLQTAPTVRGFSRVVGGHLVTCYQVRKIL